MADPNLSDRPEPEISIETHGGFTPLRADPPLNLKERLKDRLQAHNSNLSAKIHRFPASLRGFGDERHYIVPKMVAIGPYHRHLPELQAMEVVKKAAPLFFCKDDASLKACEIKVAAVAGAARICYETNSLEGVSDTAFVSMMVCDACFLLATILATVSRQEPDMLPMLCGAVANVSVVLTDMFLLENQIPWVVLEAIMTMGKVDLSAFIAKMGMNVQSRIDLEARPLKLQNYKPPHLLGLFRFYQSGVPIERVPLVRKYYEVDTQVPLETDHVRHLISSAKPERSSFWAPERERPVLPQSDPKRLPRPTTPTVEQSQLTMKSIIMSPADMPERLPSSQRLFLKSGAVQSHALSVLENLPLGTSSIELAEIGIKLTLSKTAQFKDIGLTEGTLFRKIFLPSLRLNENTACWLLNMAAFEVCTALHDNEYTVSSYLALFAMLMHREEDVHRLRAKRLIHGEFTNKQTLDFFKGSHVGNLRPGHDFYSILRRLERYKQRRWLWIAIYKFFYKNFKTILAVVSTIGVFAGIFKVLVSIKKH